MNTYRLYNYDVWGNEEDGWQVNDVFQTDKFVSLQYNWSNKRIIKSLQEQNIITKRIDENEVGIEGDENTLYFSYKGRPEFELRLER